MFTTRKSTIPQEYIIHQEPIGTEIITKIFEKYLSIGRKWKRISDEIYNTDDVTITPLTIKYIALLLKNKIDDFKNFHSYYETFPTILTGFINREEYSIGDDYKSFDEIINSQNENPNEHVIINIPRNDEENRNFRNNDGDSDWVLSDDESSE